MKNLKITRLQVLGLLSAHTNVNEIGSAEYDVWLKLEKNKQVLEPLHKKSEELVEKLKVKLKTADVETKINTARNEAQAGIQSEIQLTDEEVKLWQELTKKVDDLYAEVIEVNLETLTEKDIKNFPKDILKFRTPLLAIIELPTKEVEETKVK